MSSRSSTRDARAVNLSLGRERSYGGRVLLASATSASNRVGCTSRTSSPFNLPCRPSTPAPSHSRHLALSKGVKTHARSQLAVDSYICRLLQIAPARQILPVTLSLAIKGAARLSPSAVAAVGREGWQRQSRTDLKKDWDLGRLLCLASESLSMVSFNTEAQENAFSLVAVS